MVGQIIRKVLSRELIKRHIRIPLYKNAYYLMASSATTAILGFAFWIVVARNYNPTTLGLAAALLAAIALVAMLSILGLGTGLIRFLPSAAEKSISMINSSLTVSGLVSLGIAAIFLAGLNLWSPILNFIQDHPVYIVVFLLASVAWTHSLLLDRVFTAKQAARFTFFKNVTANTLKIPLVIVLIAFGAFGIFASVGLAISAGVLLALLWFLPSVQRGYLPVPTIHKDALNEIIHYSLINHIASMLANLPALILPLMVVNILGAESNAYFYSAWAIATMIYFIPSAISSSLLAEGSHFEELLFSNMGNTFKFGLIILTPAVCLIFALGSKVLLLFGELYSQNAATMLWPLTFSAFPILVNNIYITVNQVKKNLKTVIIIATAIACLSLGLSYLLMLKLGLIGVGLGFMIGQSIVAVAVILLMLRQSQQGD